MDFSVCWGYLLYGTLFRDDFFLCAPSARECQANMDTMVSLFSEIGIPLADDKTLGPSQCVSYVGIEIDAAS